MECSRVVILIVTLKEPAIAYPIPCMNRVFLRSVMDKLDSEGNFGQSYYLFGRGCRTCDPQKRKIRFLIPPEARTKGFTVPL